MPSDVLISEELRELLDLDVLDGLTVEWLREGQPVPAGSFRALIATLTRTIGADDLARIEGLEIVANGVVGVDNIDLEAARARSIIVTNTPDVLTEATADLTWALMLAATRRLKEAQELMRKGAWKGWHPGLLLGMELTERTLGIVGAGRIGQAVGRRAAPFGLRVVYCNPSPKPDFETATQARRVSLDDLLAMSDIVSLHAPLTKETRGLIDESRLRQMKMGATLINTARGGMVDEEAVLDSLDEGRLRAVGLDVFEGEPDVNRALVRHPQVVCLPHLGSATWETRTAMANLAAFNVAQVLAGRPAITPVVDHSPGAS